MVVVMPSFAPREECDPPVVSAQVAGVVLLIAPDVRCAVHGPRDVIYPARPYTSTPEYERETTERVECEERRGDVKHIGVTYPLVEGLLVHVDCVGAVTDSRDGCVVIEDPADVAPEEAFVWRVRVLRRIAVLMMMSVARDPLRRVALHRECTTVCEHVFEPFGCGEGLVRELPVVAERDTQTAGDKVHDGEDAKRRPVEEEGRCEGADVHRADEGRVHEVVKSECTVGDPAPGHGRHVA